MPGNSLIWHAAAATEPLRRSFIEADYDASSWATLPVPGHWQSNGPFEKLDGPVLYRTIVPTPSSAGDDARHWLVSEGIHNAADMWFDQAYLGSTEGYFVRHQFEITDYVRAAAASERTDHILGVEVISPTAREPGTKARSLLGIWDDAETVGPTWNGGGITRPVSVVSTGPVRLWNFRLLCVDASHTRATLRGTARLLSEEQRTVTIRTTLTNPDGSPGAVGEDTHHLAAGETIVEWQVVIEDPELWWPHSLGAQPLYDVVVDVELDGTVSDSLRRTTGVRSIGFDNWILSVNGERLFTKGAVHWPTRRDLAAATDAEVAADIEAAKELRLDLLRIHTHVGGPALYEAADRAGMLLWQDLPLSGPAARNLKDRAVAQAGELVDLLAHHPSIVMWCGHDDPSGTSRQPRTKSSFLKTTRTAVKQEAPSWNKSVLDRVIANAIRSADPSRRVIGHSGAWPSLPTLDGTDSHLWFGWALGTGRELTSFAKNLPRMVRFVSAFGAQSVPDHADFCEPELWPDLHWSNLQGEYGLDRRALATFVPTADYADFASWTLATQAYQATVLRRQIEFLRRLKYHPAGGFCFTALADCRPAISFAISDHLRRRKTAWGAVQAACAPVIVVADRLPAELHAGDPLSVALHVVNDRRHALATHRLSAHLQWSGGEHTWWWEGQIPADDVARIGEVAWTVPNAPGDVSLHLSLVHLASGEERADNWYRSKLVAPGM